MGRQRVHDFDQFRRGFVAPRPGIGVVVGEPAIARRPFADVHLRRRPKPRASARSRRLALRSSAAECSPKRRIGNVIRRVRCAASISATSSGDSVVRRRRRTRRDRRRRPARRRLRRCRFADRHDLADVLFGGEAFGDAAQPGVHALARRAADFADPPFGFDQRHQFAGQLRVLQRLADALFAQVQRPFVARSSRLACAGAAVPSPSGSAGASPPGEGCGLPAVGRPRIGSIFAFSFSSLRTTSTIGLPVGPSARTSSRLSSSWSPTPSSRRDDARTRLASSAARNLPGATEGRNPLQGRIRIRLRVLKGPGHRKQVTRSPAPVGRHARGHPRPVTAESGGLNPV
jgi:hypothetical protein